MNNLRRVLLGTIVYAIILVLAAPYPSAAGLMLTFPALNGLGFLYVEQSKVSGMAASMLWMPILNGALCVAYIVVFLVVFLILAPTVSAGALAWVLVFLIAVLWCALVRQSRIRGGIPRERHVIYATGVTVVGAVFLIVAFLAIGSSRLPAVQAQDIGLAQAAWRTVFESWYKIALFAIAFATFLILSERLNLSDSARGILAGLPLVPFGGLVSIAASHGPGIGERIATFKGMAVGIWLGPAVAIWFIYAVSRYFDARRPLASAKTEAAMPDFLVRLGAVALGWIACGAVIAGIAWTLEFFT
jgi:hypothetical protein